MELYPELNRNGTIELKELIDVGLILQYLSLKVESMGLGVSQRARVPKKINQIVNKETNRNYKFLYSVAVRKRDHITVVEDSLEPLQKKLMEGTILLDTPECYKNRAIYENRYQGISLDDAIFNQTDKKSPDMTSLYELSQLLWACQGETDHTTHGNRDPLDKNGFGRVHASGCAGYAVYPIVFVDKLANLEKGAYWYNPIGFSALNRWIYVNNQFNYDHFIQKYNADNSIMEIQKQFSIKFPNYIILLCIDRKKPCSGFGHSKIGKLVMSTEYWGEVEAGMALAGLQLQANALGIPWQKKIIISPEDPKYRRLFNLESVEQSIDKMVSNLENLPKNEKLSLKGHLIPAILFYVQ